MSEAHAPPKKPYLNLCGLSRVLFYGFVWGVEKISFRKRRCLLSWEELRRSTNYRFRRFEFEPSYR